jgi:hypothetical protein
MKRETYNELRRLSRLAVVFTSVLHRVSPEGLEWMCSRLTADMKDELSRRKRERYRKRAREVAAVKRKKAETRRRSRKFGLDFAATKGPVA